MVIFGNFEIKLSSTSQKRFFWNFFNFITRWYLTSPPPRLSSEVPLQYYCPAGHPNNFFYYLKILFLAWQVFSYMYATMLPVLRYKMLRYGKNRSIIPKDEFLRKIHLNILLELRHYSAHFSQSAIGIPLLDKNLILLSCSGLNTLGDFSSFSRYLWI